MKKTMALILCVATMLSLAVFPASTSVLAAASTRVSIITANPGVDCNTEIGISWIADFDCTDCFIEYKEASDSGWENAAVVKGSYNDSDYKYFIGNSYPTSSATPVFSEDHKFLNYDVDLKDLKPATRYKYRIGDGKGDYSTTHYFKTSGEAEYSFVWISDFHAYAPSSGRLTSAVNAISYAASQAKYNVDMIFSTGDTIAWGGSLYFWKQVFDQNFVKNYLYIDLNGNHDNMNNSNDRNTFNYFRITHNNPQNCYLGDSTTPYEPGVVYYTLYNDILWFVFDNESMNATIRAQVQEWAGKVIEELEGQYRYIFISEHYQWFYGQSGSNSHYGNWNDFCDKYGVDVAFSGNNHIYARTHKIYQGKVVPDDSNVGTYYIQAPSSDCDRGNNVTRYWPPTYNADLLAMTYYNDSNPARTQGASIIDVNEDGINLRLFGSETGNGSKPEFQLKDEIFISANREPAARTPVKGEDPVESEQPDSSTPVESPDSSEAADKGNDGDVNGDGKTDNLDAAVVLQYDAGITLSDGVDIDKGDVNGDGKTDNLDAALILQYDAGLIGIEGFKK